MGKLLQTLALTGLTCFTLLAAPALQAQEKKSDKLGEYDEIIIKRKGDKDGKVTIEIKDGEVYVDGKKMNDYTDGDLSVYRRRIRPVDGNAFGFNMPPRGGLQFFRDEDDGEMDDEPSIRPNKAVLGVITEKKEAAGVTVREVQPNSPAEKAGIQKGDIITAVDADKILEPKDLYEKIGDHEPGEKVTIAYLRNNKENKVTVTLDERKGMGTLRLSPPGNFRVPRGRAFPDNFNWFDEDRGGARLGLSVQDTENQEGARVLGVTEGSAAEKAGFKEDDVITQLGGATVKSARDVVDAYQDNKEKGNITAKIKRNNKEQTLEIKVPKRLNKADL